MRKAQDTGGYTIPTQFDGAGDEVTFSYDYQVLEGATGEAKVADAVETLGANAVATLIERRIKTDSRNLASASAKSANGHSTRPVLSPEQKSKNKAVRKSKNALYDKLNELGVSVEDVLSGKVSIT